MGFNYTYLIFFFTKAGVSTLAHFYFMKSSRLHKAFKVKNDEFYTMYEDIAKEVEYYKTSLKGKVVYCNCDDYRSSNFFKYFYSNYNYLGLKKLICTNYCNKQISVFDKSREYKSYKICYDGNLLTIDTLFGNGDFRSYECIKILEECDIVVTNPPFSLFRCYIDLIIKYNKFFLVVGSSLAPSYLNIFNFIKCGKLFIGVNQVIKFNTPDKNIKNVHCLWYTNMYHGISQPFLILTKKYDPLNYSWYDNYDAINVDSIRDIPYDYRGAMGVPVNIFQWYNIDNFELIKILSSPYIKERAIFKRLIVINKLTKD